MLISSQWTRASCVGVDKHIARRHPVPQTAKTKRQKPQTANRQTPTNNQQPPTTKNHHAKTTKNKPPTTSGADTGTHRRCWATALRVMPINTHLLWTYTHMKEAPQTTTPTTTNKQTSKQTNERTNEQTNKRTNEQTNKRTKQNKTKQNKTKQNKTKQNKTKQNKTKQNKTKRNKTKQNNTIQPTNLCVAWCPGGVCVCVVRGVLSRLPYHRVHGRVLGSTVDAFSRVRQWMTCQSTETWLLLILGLLMMVGLRLLVEVHSPGSG